MVTELGNVQNFDPQHADNGFNLGYVVYDTASSCAQAQSANPYPDYAAHAYDRGLVFEVASGANTTYPVTLSWPNDFNACQFDDVIGPNFPPSLPSGCFVSRTYLCQSGTVTVDAVSTTSASGSYSLTLSDSVDPPIQLSGTWSFTGNCSPLP